VKRSSRVLRASTSTRGSPSSAFWLSHATRTGRTSLRTFPATDLGKQSGRLIFDIGGNKFRLIASVDFVEQILPIERILTHEDYDREVL